jgi:hypothetical protein
MFVPSVHAPSRDLTPRARDLSKKLQETVEEFRRYYPDTSEKDVQSALMTTAWGATGGTRRTRVLVAAGAAVAAAGMGALASTGALSNPGAIGPWAAIGIAAGAIVIAVFAISRRA